jgi:glycosyltransferase involved in cell wall biosynthesis
MVSVVIPAYNAADTLTRSIDSVLAQTFDDWELIVVDDGSDDGTSDVARRYGGRVQVTHTPHVGPGEARNRGAAVSQGRYLAWLDADDVWYPTKLARQIELAESDDALEFITGNYTYMDEAGRSLGTAFERNAWLMARARRSTHQGWVIFTRRDVPMFLRQVFGATNTMMLTRGLFDRIGGFCGWLTVAEDIHLALRAVAASKTFGAVSVPVATYYLRKNSAVRRDGERSQRETVRAYQDLQRILRTSERPVQRALAEPLSRAYLDHATVLARLGRRREGMAAAWRSLRLRPRRMALTTMLGVAIGH